MRRAGPLGIADGRRARTGVSGRAEHPVNRWVRHPVNHRSAEAEAEAEVQREHAWLRPWPREIRGG